MNLADIKKATYTFLAATFAVVAYLIWYDISFPPHQMIPVEPKPAFMPAPAKEPAKIEAASVEKEAAKRPAKKRSGCNPECQAYAKAYANAALANYLLGEQRYREHA